MSTTAFPALLVKDLRVFLSDRKAVVLTLLLPIVLASFMAVVFGGVGDGGPRGKMNVVVANDDGGPLTTSIIEGLRADKTLELKNATADAARDAVKRGNAAVAVIFPAGFGKAATDSLFTPRERPEVVLVTDPGHAAESGMLRGLLTQHVMQNVTKTAFTSSAGTESVRKAMAEADAGNLPEADRARLRTMFEGIVGWLDRPAEAAGGAATEVRGMQSPFETREETIVSSKDEQRAAAAAHAFAGMTVQFVLMSAVEMGVGMLLERQRGLWKRLRAAPLDRFTLLGSRAVSGALISLIIVAVVFAFGFVVFGIRIKGSLLGFLLVAVAYSLAAACVGLLIAALGKTPSAARGVSILIVLILVMLGGAWFPSFLMPAWVQKVTTAIPTRWAVDGFEAMTWRGLGLMDGLICAGVLLGFAAVFGALAAARFRWDEA